MKKNLLLKFLLTNILITISVEIATAQLTINTGVTSATLANTLVDPSIIISNITETCPVKSRGTFTGTSNFGINTGGIVLTSGAANTVVVGGLLGGTYYGAGTRNTDACGGSSASYSSGGTTSDANLQALSGTSINDICKLEFDMIPPSDSIQLSYVFGSDEYTTYSTAGTAFNDVFGFFMTGPGIAGTVNFALLPGSPSYVGIKTVNQRACCNTYYVDNCSAATPANSIQYNGFTKVLTAKIKVTAGSTYRIKLGVADASDAIIDSGVFIKAKSIVPIALPIELIDFAATRDNTSGIRRNKIIWKTASERDNSHFELLKRTDNTPFQVVTKIPGHGTSRLPQSYVFEDTELGDGTNYYMLRQIDIDGKVALSKVTSVENRESILVHDAYPNPIGDIFNSVVEMPSDVKEAKAEILDIAGRIIRVYPLSVEPGTNNVSINTDDLKTGIYFFRIVSNSAVSRMQRIVK